MNNSTVQEIKDRLDVAEVIGSYMPLKKAGVNFKGLCPFHNEKTPSFVVTPSRQIWHCFGCGEGGDVFSFVQKYENLDFPQTLKLLADRAGVKLSEYRPEQKGQEDEKDLLVRINTFAARYYHEILMSTQGKEALDYLYQRGLAFQTIKDWLIGFAPQDFQNLNEALKQKKVLESQAVKAGVLVKNEKGNVYDRFRGRITFPVFNYVGEVVGFSARILPKLDDGKMGKYINSPETVIYNKSRVLFGLHQAKNFIRKSNEVIVVEGQMDCISAHQAGFMNTVASSGTALTAEHLVMLSRLTKNLKFCFDADQAGLNATKKAVEGILGKDFNIKIVEIGKEAKDPDELIRKNPKAWEKVVSEAKPFFEFYIEKLFGQISVLSVDTKKHIRDEILPLLKKLNDALEQEHYLKFLAQKLEVTPISLKEDLNRFGKTEYKKPKPSTFVQIPNKARLETEKQVLGGMLLESKYLQMVLKEGELVDFTTAEVASLVEKLFNHQQILENTLAKEAIFMVELLKQESASEAAFQKDLTNAFFALRTKTLKQKQAGLQSKILEAESNKNSELLASLQKEFVAVSKEIIKYKF